MTKLGLLMNIDVNVGQNKFEVYFLKYVAKMDQDATFVRILNGNNSVIFHPILSFDHTKIICSSRQIKWWQELSFK